MTSVLLFANIFLGLGCQTPQHRTSDSSHKNRTSLASPSSGEKESSKKTSMDTSDWNDQIQGTLAQELQILLEKKNNQINTQGLVDSFYRLGVQALNAKNGRIAIAALSECLQLKPQNVECHWELSWSMFLEHHYNEALSHLDWVAKIQPDRQGWIGLRDKIKFHQRLQLQALSYRSAFPMSYAADRSPRVSGIKIHAVGDTMLGTSEPNNSLPPKDLSILEYIKPLFKSSDLALANYEGTFCDDGESLKCSGGTEERSCYAFKTPIRYAKYLSMAGIQGVSLANNHIMDFGEACRTQTEQALTSEQIPWSGRPGTVARFERKGLLISMIGFHSSDHSNSSLNYVEAEKMIQEEKTQGRIVIVFFHGGAEGLKAIHVPNPPTAEIFYNENRGNVVEFAHAMVDAGADLVLGSGPHVVRGMEFYKERLIAYSLGNFATYKRFNLWGLNSLSVILEVDLQADGRFASGRLIPIKQIEFGVPIYDVNKMSIDLIRLLSRQDFPESGAYVAGDGSFSASPRGLASESTETSDTTHAKPAE